MEHIGEAEDFSVKSHVVKHWRLAHPDDIDMPVMRFKITGMFKDALSRQVREAMSIYYCKDDILNSKSEYINNCISRVTIPESDWEKKEKLRKEDEDEAKEKEAIDRFKEEILKKRKARDRDRTNNGKYKDKENKDNTEKENRSDESNPREPEPDAPIPPDQQYPPEPDLEEDGALILHQLVKMSMIMLTTHILSQAKANLVIRGIRIRKLEMATIWRGGGFGG